MATMTKREIAGRLEEIRAEMARLLDEVAELVGGTTAGLRAEQYWIPAIREALDGTEGLDWGQSLREAAEELYRAAVEADVAGD